MAWHPATMHWRCKHGSNRRRSKPCQSPIPITSLCSRIPSCWAKLRSGRTDRTEAGFGVGKVFNNQAVYLMFGAVFRREAQRPLIIHGLEFGANSLPRGPALPPACPVDLPFGVGFRPADTAPVGI